MWHTIKTSEKVHAGDLVELHEVTLEDGSIELRARPAPGESRITTLYTVQAWDRVYEPPQLWYSLHTEDPGVTGAHELVADGYERITEAQAADGFHFKGDMDVTHVGKWTAKHGGEFLGAVEITDEGTDDDTDG